MNKAALTAERIFRWVVLCVFAISNLLWGTGNSKAAASGRSFIRIPAQYLETVLQSGIRPIRLVSYGSYYWAELAETEFRRLPEAMAGGIEIVPHGGEVAIMGYRFDPLLQGEPALPADLHADEKESGFRLVQFAGPVKDEWLDQIRQTGAQVLQYYPHNSYLVWASSGQAQRINALENARWLGLVHPAYKVNADLEGRVGAIRNVAVYFFNDGAVEATLSAIASLGGKLISSFPAQPDEGFYQAIFELDAAAVTSLAHIPTVLWVGYAHPEPVLDDEMSDQIVAGNYTGSTPFPGYQSWISSLGLSGSGVVWSIIDTGVDYDHPDLAPQISGGYNFPGACSFPGEPGSDCPNGGHGTHVAGIIGGSAASGISDASGYLYGLGIAPGHSIYTMNSLSGNAWPPAGGWQEHSKIAVLGGATGGNNSWTTGEGTAHGYQASERIHDLMVLDGNFDTTGIAEPFIEVFSAGNSGPTPSSLTAPKEAKNLIVVGSSLNARAGSIDQVSGFSSRGPAVDGRYAPTIVAPGEQIASTRNDDGGQCATAIGGTDGFYAYCSGTSMAAPHASGAVILITEWWRSTHAGAAPSPAMAKALLVNGAVDMGAPDVPNNNEGWGRVHLANVIDNGANMMYFDQAALFRQSGETWSIDLSVADPSKPLKVTLAWSDAPGAVGANPALVNNLDLSVHTGGSTFLGNYFGSGWSLPGGVYDALNNLENVFLPGASGDVRINVRATQIAGDGVLYNGDSNDQSFALVCYNCVQNPDFTLAAAPASQGVCSLQDAVYEVVVGQVLGYEQPVTLSGAFVPAAPFSVGFSTNPVTPPGSSLLTVGDTAAVSPGVYDVILTGVTATRTHTATLALEVFNAPPPAPGLLAPLDGETGVALRPSFSWTSTTQAGSYTLEIAIDPTFAGLVLSADGLTATSYTPDSDLPSNMRLYWRVKTTNACGESAYSPVFYLITLTAPGDCPIGTVPQVYFADDLESGAAGWMHSGTGDSWALSGARTHSGSVAYHASDPAVPSDQRLVSPAVTLPESASNLTLQYWNYQSIEARSSGGCWDGSVLEISVDNGQSWNQVQNADLLTDPYDGSLAASINPIYPASVWCGDPQDWLESVVKLDAYAGETVQFRYRLGSDASINREGWYLDDIAVQGCVPGSFAAVIDPPTTTLITVPGEPVTHSFTIKNLGIDDVYGLTVSGGSWPTSLLSPQMFALAPGMSAEVQVQVLPPPVHLEQLITGKDTFTLTVQSQYSNTLVLTASGATDSVIHPALDLSPPVISGFGPPGETITHTFTLTNMGDYTDTIGLVVGGNLWDSEVTSPVTLGAGESRAVIVRVDIPLGLPVDVIIAEDSFTLTASSSWDPKLTASASGLTQASTDLAVSLEKDQAGTGLPGTGVDYTFTVRNTGLYTDTYALSASGIWSSELSASSSGPLEPGGQFTVTLTVQIPVGAALNDSQEVTLRATSSFSPGIYAQATVFTTALWNSLYLPAIFQ